MKIRDTFGPAHTSCTYLHHPRSKPESSFVESSAKLPCFRSVLARGVRGEGAITTEATTVELTQPSPTRTCTIADAAELSLTHATAVVVVGVVVVAVF